MTRAEAKKKILGVFLNELSNDDEELFGIDVVDAGEDSRLWKAFDAARNELVEEFKRRTKDNTMTRESLTPHMKRLLIKTSRHLRDFLVLHRAEAVTAQALETRGLGTYRRTDEALTFKLSEDGRRVARQIFRGQP